MAKNNLKKIITGASVVFSLLGEGCYREIRNCNVLEAGKKKVETCVTYDNKGEAEARYTVYNGWELPSLSIYDKGLDGEDEKVKYFYNRHHKLRKELIKKGNGTEERYYDNNGKVVLLFVDEEGRLERMMKK